MELVISVKFNITLKVKFRIADFLGFQLRSCSVIKHCIYFTNNSYTSFTMKVSVVGTLLPDSLLLKFSIINVILIA